jgi:hypothetical protein
MNIIVSGRRGGKTHACLVWALAAKRRQAYPFWDRVVLCINVQEADRLRSTLQRMARSLGWDKTRVGLTYDLVYAAEEWTRIYHGHDLTNVQVMLDNADIFLQDMFRGHLKAVTWTQRADQPEDRIHLLPPPQRFPYMPPDK